MHTTTWPGHDYGTRAPEARETPLSTAEVIVGLQDLAIGADLTPAQRKEAIEAMGGNAMPPILRMVGMWGGLLAHTASAATDHRAAVLAGKRQHPLITHHQTESA